MRLLGYILIGCSVIAAAYGMTRLGRWANYRFNTEAYVEQTVRDMVKAEALR